MPEPLFYSVTNTAGYVVPKEQECIRNLRNAIEDKGPCPEFHREIMRRHRAEWPALWRAIDSLLAQD